MPLATRLIAAAIIVAVLSGLVAVAALALWVTLMLIPVALLAGAAAWAMLKFRTWRRGASGRSLRWPAS